MSSNDPHQHADDSPSNFLSIMSKKCTVCDISKDLILGVIIMRGRTDKEIAKTLYCSYANPWVFRRRKCGRSGRLGPNEVEALSNTYSKIARRQESREWVVEVIYEHDWGEEVKLSGRSGQDST